MKRTIWSLVSAAVFMAGLAYVANGQAPAAPPARGAAAAPGAGQGPGAGAPRGGARGPVVPPGPPQPVPPQVAIPRPTAAEVAQINDEITKMINANNSAAKPLLDKYRSLAVVQVPRDNSAIRPVPRQAARHDSFVEIAKKGDIDLLLLGDSITDLWRQNEANSATYATYFGKYKVANFAISGDTTQGVLWGLQNGEGAGFQPKAIMMMIGTNNSGGNTGPEIAEGVGAIVLELRKDFPNAKILLLAIFPRGAPTVANRRVNAEASTIYSRLADNKNIFYMDIGQKFLSPDGTISTEIMADGLHPTAAGYVVWGDAIKDKIAELMK